MILGNAVLCSFPRKHIQGIVMDEEEDDFFITHSIISIIINIIISILCWCFCVVYKILQKKCTYTVVS
jgi:hypothetical protein